MGQRSLVTKATAECDKVRQAEVVQSRGWSLALEVVARLGRNDRERKDCSDQDGMSRAFHTT